MRYLLLIVALVGCDPTPSRKCISEKCHMKTDWVFIDQGDGTVMTLPMTREHCECLAYECNDAGVR